jgi:hypothetical protein
MHLCMSISIYLHIYFHIHFYINIYMVHLRYESYGLGAWLDNPNRNLSIDGYRYALFDDFMCFMCEQDYENLFPVVILKKHHHHYRYDQFLTAQYENNPIFSDKPLAESGLLHTDIRQW